MLAPELLEILVCPQCKGTLDLDHAETGFTCPAGYNPSGAYFCLKGSK